MAKTYISDRAVVDMPAEDWASSTRSSSYGVLTMILPFTGTERLIHQNVDRARVAFHLEILDKVL